MFIWITTVNQIQNKDLALLAKNYDDFSNYSNRESLKLPLYEQNDSDKILMKYVFRIYKIVSFILK